MAWSKWRAAVVLVLLGSVGLAWSQSPMFNRPASSPSSERIMTVHENGQALRCRVIQSWKTPAGAQAHQLQVLETGAMLTILEDGVPTTVSQGPGSQVRALPMRIFHWSTRDRTPAGAPVPPTSIQTAVATPSTTSSGIQTVSSKVSTAMPVITNTSATSPTPTVVSASPVIATSTPTITQCNTQCNQCVTGRGKRHPGCTNCQERLITWEEGSRPVVIYPGSTAMPTSGTNGPVIVENSGPTIIEGSRRPLLQRTRPQRPDTLVLSPQKSGGHSGVVTAAVVGDSTGTTPVGKTTTIIQSSEPMRGSAKPTVRDAEKPTVRDSEKPTMRDKLSNLLHKPAVRLAEPKAVDVKKDDKTTVAAPASVQGVKKDDKTTVTGPASTQGVKKDDKKASTVAAATAAKNDKKTLPAATVAKDDKKPTLLPPVAKDDKKSTAAATKMQTTTIPVAQKDDKKPFSTATAQATTIPKATPSMLPRESGSANVAAKKDGKIWGKGDGKLEQPGQATIDREKIRKDLPPASQADKRLDILMAPEKFNPDNDKVNPKVSADLANLPAQQLPQAGMPQAGVPQPNLPVGNVSMPLGAQSVLAARNGAPGPVQYIPVPVATVPEPVRPPIPPEPKLPQPPNPAAYLNAFSPPPAPQGQQQMPPLTPEQMQIVMQHQAMMQQQAYLHQVAMAQRMQAAHTAQLVPVGNGMPMQVRYPANYTGPQPPNPVAQQQPMFPVQQAGFGPLPQVAAHPAMDRRVMPAAAQQPVGSDSETVGQLIRVLRESQFPAQREWAAANLATYDHRVYPHVPHVLALAARQDAAPTVRAAAVYALSRMNVQSEMVLGTFEALRGDADPRVRQEVEQAYGRMGLTPRQ